MQGFNEISLQGIAHEETVNVCPDCGSKNLEYRKGELFCKKCGLLIE